MAERYSSFSGGSTRWFLQRISAAFLVVTLAFHFLLLHFFHHAPEITFSGSAGRYSVPAYFITMVLFLAAATFHGTNGVYNALVNQGVTGTPKRVAKWVLVVAGVLVFVQGIRVALTLMGASA
ncbi:succinate dehydrogenase [Halarchaeum salinum]|uniref:Succinate dehydrogenase hydrophobic membrane anchor subunit n=1 Tax=Halarchaeum salinum TaxID=489912 RepID=A0AAV3S7T7_9EURY